MRRTRITCYISEGILCELRGKGISNLSALIECLLVEFSKKFNPKTLRRLSREEIQELVSKMMSADVELTQILQQLQQIIGSSPIRGKEEPPQEENKKEPPKKEKGFWEDKESRFKFMEDLIGDMIKEQEK